MNDLLVTMLAVFVFGLLGCACSHTDRKQINSNEKVPVVLAIIAIRSPRDMNTVLEQRWPLEFIDKWVNNTPPNRIGIQNLTLVPADMVWRQEMYEKENHTFDRIHWYAKFWRGEIKYSVNAKRGESTWTLELGDAEDLLNSSMIPVEPIDD